MIIQNVGQARKYVKGEPYEVILKEDDGAPETFFKLEEKYAKVNAIIDEINAQPNEPEKPVRKSKP